MADYTFDRSTHIITVDIADNEITVQDLLNAIREYEDEQDNMDLMQIAEASGKEDLGGEVYVGITVKLLDWKVKFADRPGEDYVLCNIRGGNLVAVNQVGVTMNPIEPSTYVTVSLTASSSATFIQQEILGFAGFIHIDTVYGTTGTSYPQGTPASPVNNLTDALVIHEKYEIHAFKLRGQITLTEDLDYHTFEGISSAMADAVNLNGKSLTNCRFERLTITGSCLGTNMEFTECILVNVSGIHGLCHGCAFSGTITLTLGTTLIADNALFMSNPTTVDMGGINRYFIAHCKAGHAKFVNADTGSSIQVTGDYAMFEIDSSCVAGTLFIRGSCHLTNNSTMTVMVERVIGSDIETIKKIRTNRWKIANNQLTIYDDDGVTPLKTFNLKNKAGDPTETEPYERVPV